jgi:hypothetical protein
MKQSTRCHVQGNNNLHICHHENLMSQKDVKISGNICPISCLFRQWHSCYGTDTVQRTRTYKMLNTVNIIFDTKWLLSSLIIPDYNRDFFLLSQPAYLKRLTAETCIGGCDKSICQWAVARLEMFCCILRQH